jgi:ABC-type Fe3+ transport system substrate-binding protein
MKGLEGPKGGDQMKRVLAAVACLALGLAGPAIAQTVRPDLAPSWTYMQKAMPGVPYQLLEAACAEGALMIYNGTWSDAQKNQVEEFNKHFPCVKARNFELGTSERRERFISEAKAGRNVVDIVQDTDPTVLNQQADEGLLANYKITTDASFLDTQKKSGFWYPLRLALVANAWNTDNVKDADAKLLARWEGINDPRFKGRIGVVVPSGNGGASLYPFYAIYKMYGEEFMKKFAAQKPRNFGNANTIATALASGDVDVALMVSETGLNALYVSGAPIQWTLPEPGVGTATGQAINAAAPHPNAARLYQEYAFSDDGYGVWNKIGGAPAKVGFKDTRDVAKEKWYVYPKKFFPVDENTLLKEKDDFVKMNNAWFGIK